MERIYALLDVEPGASLDEITESYFDLLKVWQPERFSEDPRLQEKARRKLAQITEAYRAIKAIRTDIAKRPDEPKAAPLPEPVPNSAVFSEQPKLQPFSPVESPAAGREEAFTPPREASGKSLIVKAFWGVLIGFLIAAPVSGFVFLQVSGFMAAALFVIIWLGVLIYKLMR